VHSSIHADQVFRQLALSVARNNLGAMRPVHEIAAAEGLTPTEYDGIAANPLFKRYLEAYTKELQDNGFSIQAKSRLLAEDLLPTMYHLARDPDAPAAARVKIFENFVELADAKPKATAVAPGAGFSITINIPQVGQQAPQTLVLEANSPENPQKALEEAPRNTLAALQFAEPEDYEYAGEDYL
jgi:hypothetical protein